MSAVSQTAAGLDLGPWNCPGDGAEWHDSEPPRLTWALTSEGITL